MIGHINVCEAKKEKGDRSSGREGWEEEKEKSRERKWEELRPRDKEAGEKFVGSEKKRTKGWEMAGFV